MSGQLLQFGTEIVVDFWLAVERPLLAEHGPVQAIGEGRNSEKAPSSSNIPCKKGNVRRRIGR